MAKICTKQYAEEKCPNYGETYNEKCDQCYFYMFKPVKCPHCEDGTVQDNGEHVYCDTCDARW